jgi:hypothetical protein
VVVMDVEAGERVAVAAEIVGVLVNVDNGGPDPGSCVVMAVGDGGCGLPVGTPLGPKA